MKIIKYGVIPEDREYVQKCHICKSIFVYKESESTYEMDMEGNVEHYVKCPVCEYHMLVSSFRKKYNKKKHGDIIKDIDSKTACENKEENDKEEIKETKILGFRGGVESDRTNK